MYRKIYSDHDNLGNVRLLDLPPLQLDVDISESTNPDEMMSQFELIGELIERWFELIDWKMMSYC